MIEKILKVFKNKSITIFGGTGTIGTIIVEYLQEFNPKVIRIFSNDENSLWKSQMKWGNDNMRYLLGDIRNLERVRTALNKVDYVFNCAAIKHVPFAEYNPLEAVNVNIIGLNNIICGCIEKKIKKLLHISTDKAVEPSTVMGASKMIGERLIQIRWTQNPTIQMITVRLGNVYGSRGSIVPLIRKCKKEHRPITLTDIKMARYFMYPNEVRDFIIKTFINGKNGEIWVPKLKLQFLTDIIKKEVGRDYPVEIIGNRRAEKLTESLLFTHEVLDAIEFEDSWIIPNDHKKCIKY